MAVAFSLIASGTALANPNIFTDSRIVPSITDTGTYPSTPPGDGVGWWLTRGLPVRSGGLQAILDNEIFAGSCGQAIAGGNFVAELLPRPDVACVRSIATGDLAELSVITIVDGRLSYGAAGSGAFCRARRLTPDGGPSGVLGGGGGCCATTGGGRATGLLLMFLLAYLVRRRRRS